MQSVSSRIWTRVAKSISCEDNHYTMGTSNNCMYIVYIKSEFIFVPPPQKKLFRNKYTKIKI